MDSSDRNHEFQRSLPGGQLDLAGAVQGSCWDVVRDESLLGMADSEGTRVCSVFNLEFLALLRQSRRMLAVLRL